MMYDCVLRVEEWAGKGQLVLRNLEPKDSGTISCIVSTDIDTVRSAISFHCQENYKNY
jgi:hypothetical protein